MDNRTAPDNAKGMMLEKLEAGFCLYCAAAHNVRAGPLRLRERRGGCAHGAILHPWTASGKGEPSVLKSDQRAARRHNSLYGHCVVGVTHIREASEAEVRQYIEEA